MTAHEFTRALLAGPDVPILCPGVTGYRDDGSLFPADFHQFTVLRNPDIPGCAPPDADVIIIAYAMPKQEGHYV